MPDDTLPTIRQKLFNMLRNEGVSFGPECGRHHTARAVTGELGQRISNGFRLTQGNNVGTVPLLEVLAGLITRHDTRLRKHRHPFPSIAH